MMEKRNQWSRTNTIQHFCFHTHTRRHRWVSALSPGWEAGIGVVASWSNINSIPGDRATGGSVLKDQPDTVCVCVRGTVLDSISETIVTAPRSGGPSPPSVRVILHITVFQSLKYKRHCVRSEAFFIFFFLFFYPWLTLQLTQRQISQQQ